MFHHCVPPAQVTRYALLVQFWNRELALYPSNGAEELEYVSAVCMAVGMNLARYSLWAMLFMAGNTKYMTSGAGTCCTLPLRLLFVTLRVCSAARGPGIYMATQAQTSLGYCSSVRITVSRRLV